MDVWLVVHSEGMYEDYESVVRAVCATHEIAERVQNEREDGPKGGKGTGTKHDRYCCDIEEREVITSVGE